MNKAMEKRDRLIFLGSGAADWIVPNQDGAFRRHSSLLAYGDVLIDCPASTIEALDSLGIPRASIAHLLITHSHNDHFDAKSIRAINDSRHSAGCTPLKIYAHAAVTECLRSEGVEAIAATHGAPFHIGSMQVTPLKANHRTNLDGECPLHYLVESAQATWLYATDGAWLPCASWGILRRYALDALIIDATIGDGHDGDYRIFEHNSLPMIRIMASTMIAQGVLRDGAPIYLTHMARTLHPSHRALSESLTPPFIAAYDGMVCRVERK